MCGRCEDTRRHSEQTIRGLKSLPAIYVIDQNNTSMNSVLAGSREGKTMRPIERHLGPPILACLSRPLEEDLFASSRIGLMFLTPSCRCHEHFPDSVLALYAFGLGRAS